MKIFGLFFALFSICLTACEPATKNNTETIIAEDTAGVIKNDSVAQVNTEESPLALALSSNAIQIITKTNGSTREINFNTPQERTIDIIKKVLKAKPTISLNSECGAGPLKMATWDNGLTLLFQEIKGEWLFVGWAANQAKDTNTQLGTMAGIGVGSTRKEMETAYVINVQKTSLGYEFTTKSNDLFGIFNAAGEAAKITNLWSGVSCNFR